jgi:hypothetical protein
MISSQANVSPLRQRMTDDMRMRQLSPKTRIPICGSCMSLPGFSGARLGSIKDADHGCDLRPMSSRNSCGSFQQQHERELQDGKGAGDRSAL